jgi:hypothetical protein
MNQYGFIKSLQDAGVKTYLNISQRFRENNVIRDLWNVMAHDVSQQIDSLNALPSSFWIQSKQEQDGLLSAISSIPVPENVVNKQDLSLKACFECTLSYEEPIILGIYVPIIRNLRSHWTDHALDFYIMVKAHLARIVRISQEFSGDPLIIQRSNLLLRNFEKDVQVAQAISRQEEKAPVRQPARITKPKHNPKKILKRDHHLAKRSKTLTGHVKPLVEKVSLRRRTIHR